MAGQKAQLLIELDEQGNIGVSGPINNKMLCYGLLGCARDAIRDFGAQQRSAISIAKPGDVPDASKDRRLSFDAPLSRSGT